MSKITVEQIIEALGGMTGVELNELSKKIQEHFGIEGMPVMGAVAAGGGDAAGGESSEFDVKITAVENKMGVIKHIKAAADLGLKEAKDYVEDEKRKTIGDLMGKSFSKEDAQAFAKALEEAGAKAEVVSK